MPSFKIKTINIGDRQKGRFYPKSVISLDYKANILTDKINNLKNKKIKKHFQIHSIRIIVAV